MITFRGYYTFSLRFFCVMALLVGATLSFGKVASADNLPPAVGGIIPVGSAPIGISQDALHVWVTNGGDNTVSEIDKNTGAVVATIAVGQYPAAVSSDGSHVWVANSVSGTVSELDATTGALLATINVGAYPYGISSDGSHVWVANFLGNSVSEINCASHSVVATIPVLDSPSTVTSDGTHVWVASAGGYFVTEIDTTTGNVVQEAPVDRSYPGPYGIAADSNHVWVANAGGNTVSELSATTGSLVATIPVGSDPGRVSDDGRHVWVTDAGSNQVTEIDASTGTVLSTFNVSARPLGIVSDGFSVWVASQQANVATEFVLPSPPGSPSVVSTQATSSAVTISWTPGAPNGSTITSETIYVYSGSTLVTTDTSCTGSPCTVTGLTNGTSYTFKVSDTNGVGEGALSSASNAVTPAAVPSTPSGVTTTRGNSQATVSWTDGAANGSAITSQTIYVYAGSTLVTTDTACTGSPCTVTGLTNGTSYTFKVSDTNGVGEGALSSASSSVTPATTPGVPTSVSVVASGGQAVISWVPPTSNGGSTISSYTASTITGSHACTYNVTTPETDSCTISGLTSGTSYTFQVTATNAAGTSSASTGVTATVLFPAPTLVSAVAAMHQVTLTWTAPLVTNGKIVSFTGSVTDGNGHSFFCSGSKTAKKCVISGLTDLTTYIASVTATENNGGTTSAASNTLAATPAQPVTLPFLHPVALTSNPHTATFLWGSAGGGDGQVPEYTVTVFNPNGSTFSSTVTSGNTATVTGLTAQVKYSYSIKVTTAATLAGWTPAVTTKATSFKAK